MESEVTGPGPKAGLTRMNGKRVEHAANNRSRLMEAPTNPTTAQYRPCADRIFLVTFFPALVKIQNMVCTILKRFVSRQNWVGAFQEEVVIARMTNRRWLRLSSDLLSQL